MKNLKKFLVVGACAFAAVSATPALAVTLLVRYDPITDPRGAFTFNVESEPVVDESAAGRGFFTAISNGTGQYLGLTSLAFYHIDLNGLFGNYYGAQIYSGPEAAPSIFRSGSYAATFFGDESMAGTVTISAVGAVPEPATWALMLLGFGSVGFVLRRRRQTTTVGFQTA